MRTPAPLGALLLVLAAMAAGCLGGPSLGDEAAPGDEVEGDGPRDLPVHRLGQILSFATTAVDGARLAGHVYLPDGEGPFATILNYSPYWNTLQGRSDGQEVDRNGRPTMPGLYGTMLDAGFAVALVNIRGTGLSDGCNSWFDPHLDGSDAYRVIQALAEQPWSNGNVGMIGISWNGWTQYAALAEQPPALKAVAPSSAILEQWTLWTRHGPTINSQFGPTATTWATFQAAVGIGAQGIVPPSRADCPQHVDQVRAYHQLTVDGDRSAFFEHRDLTEIFERNTVPMFVTNGLSRFTEGHILQIDGLWDVLPPERRLLIGQWGHAYPSADAEYPRLLVEWFDHYLRDGPKTVETGIVDYQDDVGTWHRSPRWPPDHDTTRLWLSDGALVADPGQVRASTQAFQSAYVDPRPDICPGNKAVYVSPPLAEDVLLAGNFRANVTLSSTLQNGNVGLHLWNVPDLLACQDGAATLADIVHGIEVSRALSDLRHRGHLEQGRPFPVATPDVMAMQSHPFASHVKAGERLILGVGGGAAELALRPEMPLLTVHTGPSTEGWIDLPVVEGRLVFR